jgi:hypothetical protein
MTVFSVKDRHIFIGLLWVLFFHWGFAPARPVPEGQAPIPAPGQPLPIDPNVITGSLENGLRYFIRVNHKPEQRAELRLVVNAGSPSWKTTTSRVWLTSWNTWPSTARNISPNRNWWTTWNPSACASART